MEIALASYGIILAIVFLYSSNNLQLYNIIIRKYGRQKGIKLLKLFRMAGIILLTVFILKMFLIALRYLDWV